ncbi:MAG: phosphotransferase [Dehalococcoidia bacterium]|nr:phosphotransferase [Dehalococcoidia bacterium]
MAGDYRRRILARDAALDCHVERGGQRETHPLILRKQKTRRRKRLGWKQAGPRSTAPRSAACRAHVAADRQPYLVVDDPSFFEHEAMIIQRMPGSGEVLALFHGDRTQHAEAVATQLCEHLAALHLADSATAQPGWLLDDPRGVGIDTSSWDAYIDTTVDYYIRSYDDFAFDPVPVFRDAYLVMRNQRPRPLPLRVVHGDYNPANFLYEDGTVTAIIDWKTRTSATRARTSAGSS